jgi:hypothetical protein
MPFLVLILLALGAYVVLKSREETPPAPDDEPTDFSTGIHVAPRYRSTEHTRGATLTGRVSGTFTGTGGVVTEEGGGPRTSSENHLDIARALINPQLNHIEFEPAGGPTQTPFNSLVGDFQVEVRGPGTGRRHRAGRGPSHHFLVSPFPRGEKINHLSVDDPMSRSSSVRHIIDIEGHETGVWTHGNPIPEHVAHLPAYINPLFWRSAELKQVLLMVDMSEALGVQSPVDLFILGDSSTLFRVEQDIRGRTDIWRTIASTMIPIVTSILGSAATGMAAGVGGGPMSQAILGIIKKVVTISLDIATRRNKLEALIGNALGLLTPENITSVVDDVTALNVSIGLHRGSTPLTLNAETKRGFIKGLNVIDRANAMREKGISTIPPLDSAGMLKGLNAEKALASVISNNETRVEAYKEEVLRTSQPYRVTGIKVYT